MRAVRGGVAFSDINVTPMVDVMLVLLIIFMVAAPMFEQGITVAVPKAATGQELPGSNLVIALTRDHLIYFNREAVTLKELRERLEGASRTTPIIVRSDESAYVRRLVELWDLCRDMGFREIRISTAAD